MEVVTGILFSSTFPPQYRRTPASLAAGTPVFRRLHRKTPFHIQSAACKSVELHGGDEIVNFIGIGSRKYSVIDFCLDSFSVCSSRFRFWTIYSRDHKKVQLLERCHSKDVVIRNVEFPLSQLSHQPTIILLASSGHGLDHIAAMDLLNNVKSVGGLAIAIILKPFSFEGHRRQKEVNDLVNNLKSCLNFYIVVEADSFFKVGVGTLAEALESANNTVLLAVNTISSMISKVHAKILNTSDGKFKHIEPSEVIKAMEKYREVKIYHGAGYNVNAAIMQAILHCPSFDVGLKDLNELAILTLTCACNIGDSDLPQIISSFREITGYAGDIIFSKMCELNLEQKVVATTILIMGYNEKLVTPSKGFFSGLLHNLPSLFHNFKVHSTEAASTSSNSCLGDTVLSSGSGSTLDLDLNTSYPLELIPEEDEFPDMLKNLLLRKEHDPIKGATDPVETNLVSNNNYDDPNYGEKLDIVGMNHSSHHIGPAFQVAELWAKKCFQSRARINDKVEISSLPVGVRPYKLSPDCSSYSDHKISENLDYINQETSSEITADMSKKNSVLSVRASMMLEAERGSPKGWNSIVEISYRGGIYRGRCQGGLPDGKGQLTFMDGSFYEGFWKSGKRSGLGTFCYNTGDLFRGPWRDDVMHGKGWFYFHTGDRWFANFWRGKANGEGRFFSKNGSVFFGIFRDGWRHGQSVCIDADGSRWTELWDDGVLVDRKADN